MKKSSIWLDGINTMMCPRLEKNIDVDVLIMGGGITGISTAFNLIGCGLNVCLVEANLVGCGVTSRTTGKLTYLQENIYSKLKNIHGFDKTKLYLESQIEAIKFVKENILKQGINCNFEKVKSYVFSYEGDKKIDEEIRLLNDLGIDLRVTDVLPTEEKVGNSYFVDDTYVFHPLKYLYALKDICVKNDIQIYENTRVLEMKKSGGYFECKTEYASIKAKKVVLAIHYPYFLLPFMMPLKSYIEKSYIEAFKVSENYKFSAINISKPIISIRYHEDNNDIYQLFLSNSHNYCCKNNEVKNFKKLLDVKRMNVDYMWSNKDVITNDLLPFIGYIDENLLIGTGYNTWGMTNGSLAGKILSDIILKRKNRYLKLFDPHRNFNIGKLISFPVVLWSSAYSFIKNKVSKQKEWYSKHVRFEKRSGKNVGIYVDEEGVEHIVYNLCPHMKCSLIFNEEEKTWDCPCHGSRFDVNGKVIEGPSNYDIGFNE